jgi:hypothetical protein
VPSMVFGIPGFIRGEDVKLDLRKTPASDLFFRAMPLSGGIVPSDIVFSFSVH